MNEWFPGIQYESEKWVFYVMDFCVILYCSDHHQCNELIPLCYFLFVLGVGIAQQNAFAQYKVTVDIWRNLIFKCVNLYIWLRDDIAVVLSFLCVLFFYTVTCCTEQQQLATVTARTGTVGGAFDVVTCR